MSIIVSTLTPDRKKQGFESCARLNISNLYQTHNSMRTVYYTIIAKANIKMHFNSNYYAITL